MGDKIKSTWCKHEFTEEELKRLYAGEEVYMSDCITRRGNRFECFVSWTYVDGVMKVTPRFTK